MGFHDSPDAIRLRPATLPDERFLRDLFIAARPHLQIPGLPDDQLALLIDMQWRAQRNGYAAAWPSAVDTVIEYDGSPAGRLLVDPGGPGGGITVVDLVVAPAYRRQGIATAALQIVLADADRGRREVRLRVAQDNIAARTLYDRLGFRLVEADDVDALMVR